MGSIILIQGLNVGEQPATKEVVLDIFNRTLHLPFGLRVRLAAHENPDLPLSLIEHELVGIDQIPIVFIFQNGGILVENNGYGKAFKIGKGLFHGINQETGGNGMVGEYDKLLAAA